MPEKLELARPFYERFREKVVSEAEDRGVETPEWEDILLVSSEMHDTAEVFHEKKISPHGIQRDVKFSLNFGRPEPMVLEPHASTPHIIGNATEKIKEDLASYIASKKMMSDPLKAEVATELLTQLNFHVAEQRSRLVDPFVAEKSLDYVTQLNALIEPFFQQYLGQDFKKALSNSKREDPNYLAELDALNSVRILDDFMRFVSHKTRLIIDDQNPIQVLDSMNNNLGSSKTTISPLRAVETVQQLGGPFVKYLLHRNGLKAKEDYEPPCQMPSPTIISHALSALNFSEERGLKKVEIKHLIPALVTDPSVMKVLIDLDTENKLSSEEEVDDFFRMVRSFSKEKSRDFSKFYRTIVNSLAPQVESGDVFRVNPKISEELRKFLVDAEPKISKGSKTMTTARLFGLVLKDKYSRSVLRNAGLTSEQMKRWNEAYKKAEEKQLKIDVGEKDSLEEPFKVSEKHLEDLLREYGSDRTKLALEGKLDPVIGREKESIQIQKILLQRGKSSPLLLGEPGVGKTALFDAFAQDVVAGRVAEPLLGSRVISLDLAGMNKNAMFRGEFEGKLIPIIDGVVERNKKKDKPPIILCIDELHSAILAGTASGTPGAGEHLKQPLARGELSIIGATTQDDYARDIEKDPALNRRFDTIFVDEPTPEATTQILEGLHSKFVEHHKIDLSQDLLHQIVKLTNRYLPNQFQPDKAITLMDSAFAYAKINGRSEITKKDIVEMIAQAAKVSSEFLLDEETKRYLDLRTNLPEQVIGHDEQMREIADALIIAKADLHDPRKPIAKFLLMGPTGVGKSETGKALARLLFGSEDNLIRIDMEGYQEKHEASRLFGAPPGYVGYGEEGALTGQVRRKPYSVVLLDEIEKAHPDIQNTILSILDEGEVSDGRGKKISFRNTIILMSSNAGAAEAQKQWKERAQLLRAGTQSWHEVTKKTFENATKEFFRPEFLGRLDGQFVFEPLDEDNIRKLVTNEVLDVERRLMSRWGLKLELSDEILDALRKKGHNEEFGARFLKKVVRDELLKNLAPFLLEHSDNLKNNGVLRVSELGENFNPEIFYEPEKTS